jgi:hypothetical protein
MDANSPNDYLNIHYYHRFLARGNHEDGMRTSGEQLTRSPMCLGNEVEIGHPRQADRSSTCRQIR